MQTPNKCFDVAKYAYGNIRVIALRDGIVR